jgi:uncharacterized protein (DUF1800 family)
VNQVAGGDAQLGTISSTGLYTPPAAIPPSSSIAIGATSVADSSISQTLSVVIQAAPVPTATAVTVAGPSSVNVGSTAQYTAVVTGVQDQTVTWAVNGTSGGNAALGTISVSGLYTPPASVPTANNITISAASANTPSVSGSTTASILEPVPVISIAVGSTQDNGLTYLVDVQGSGFVNGASLVIGGQAVTTDAVGPNDLQTTVSNPSGQPTQISLVVQNPNPGQTQSAATTVSLTLPLATPIAAARFLDQTSFGPTQATIAHVQQIGLTAALQEQFNEPSSVFSQPPSPDSECPLRNFNCTQSDFLKIALEGNDQLRQRVAMALSELWVASNSNDNTMPYYLNTLADDAFTNYRTIMHDVTLSPAMGFALNMVDSGVAPAGQIANENYGREIMQLFCLGLNLLNPDGTQQTDANGNPIPTYTEDQIQQFARAFTGWTYAPADGSAPTTLANPANFKAMMMSVDRWHDTTAKTLLNGTTLPAGQTAEEDLEAALDNIFAHPNIGPFVSRQLIQHLVEGDPSPAYVERVAAVFANNGSGVRGDMKAVLTAILMDPEARAGDTQTGDQADATPTFQNGGHLREPLLWTTGLLRGLNVGPVSANDPYPFVKLSSLLAYVNEAPYSQETVFNFFSPKYVIPQTNVNSPEFGMENTGSVPLEQNMANFLLNNQIPGMFVDVSATSAAGQQAGNPAQLVDYLGAIYMHSQMPSDMRNALIATVSAIPASAAQSRVTEAVFLIVTSAQYKIIH